jgi:hypothetical protein
MEEAENARQMLHKQAVREGRMGRVLAAYLVEHLPFESEAEKQIDTVRLVLQPGLLEPEQREDLWRKAARKAPYFVGFIATLPDAIPDEQEPHPLWSAHRETLVSLADAGNPVAAALLRVLSPAGQAWVQTLYRIFKKPSTQDVVNITLDEMAAYFGMLRDTPMDATLEELEAEAKTWMSDNAAAREVLDLEGDLEAAVFSVRVLSGMGYGVVRPVFKGTTAIGSLMRRKLEPVMTPLAVHLDRLAARPARR